MKILWISYFGSWTRPLLQQLSSENDMAVIVPGRTEGVSEECGARIFNVIVPQQDAMCRMSETVFSRYNKIIREFQPDVIHVHGTEKNLAQIQNFISDIPVVISIQGILSGYIPFDNGYLRDEDIRRFRTLKNSLGQGGCNEMHRKFVVGMKNYEKDILTNGRYFFCRTNWDKAWVTFSNPKATIFQGEELLRQPFYDNAGSWNLKGCNRHTIFMPSGFNPIKGLHIALKTIVLLKKFFPDVRLIVPGLPRHILDYEGIRERLVGEEFVCYCKDIIRRNNISDNVVLLDRLDAEGMTREMQKANVFLSPSSIDNSPNAVGEAMMVGMPIVCSPVGGTTSFLHDEENCLIAPAGDEYITAYQIKRLFENPQLVEKLTCAAVQTARKRHDKTAAATQYISAYKEIISIQGKEGKV